MTKIQLKQTAFNLAFSTIGQNLSALDAAVAAKATELKLPDPKYNQFRNDALAYRAGLLVAYQADAKAAQAATKAAPVAQVAPVPAPQKQ